MSLAFGTPVNVVIAVASSTLKAHDDGTETTATELVRQKLHVLGEGTFGHRDTFQAAAVAVGTEFPRIADHLFVVAEMTIRRCCAQIVK